MLLAKFFSVNPVCFPHFELICEIQIFQLLFPDLTTDILGECPQAPRFLAPPLPASIALCSPEGRGWKCRGKAGG